MSEWYLVYCKARQEESAARGLEEQGYTVYLPQLATKRRRAGGLTEIIQPLFPRYMFVSTVDESQSIVPVRYTRGVRNIVRFGNVFLPVATDIVDDLRKREDSETGYHRLVAPTLKPGDRVRIGSGVLQGIEAVFEARTGSDRVVILLDLLGRQTRTELPIEELEE